MARHGHQQSKSPAVRVKYRVARVRHTRGWMRRLERELHEKQARRKK